MSSASTSKRADSVADRVEAERAAEVDPKSSSIRLTPSVVGRWMRESGVELQGSGATGGAAPPPAFGSIGEPMLEETGDASADEATIALAAGASASVMGRWLRAIEDVPRFADAEEEEVQEETKALDLHAMEDRTVVLRDEDRTVVAPSSVSAAVARPMSRAPAPLAMIRRPLPAAGSPSPSPSPAPLTPATPMSSIVPVVPDAPSFDAYVIPRMSPQMTATVRRRSAPPADARPAWVTALAAAGVVTLLLVTAFAVWLTLP